MSQFTQTKTDNSENVFRPPSRASEPIIKQAILNFHDINVAVPDCLIPHHNLEERFGILSIHMRDEIPVVPEILFQCSVDCSGSMGESCTDRRTKMSHILHTIENMIRIFHKKTNSKISIRIQSFDSSVYIDIDTVEDIGQKTQEEIEAIIAKVRKITPQGSTNIEKALKATTTYLNQYIKDHPTCRVAHIFLTDGEITEGNNDKSYLKTLVSDVYPNIFMGYGLEHDDILLTSLGSTSLHNEYRFVDNLEKAGLVYGEVIHQLLYTALEDVTLKAENCEIYNYATNSWTTSLDIGHLVSEQKKTFQIRTNTPNYKDALIAIYGRTIHQTRAFEVLSNDIDFQTHALPFIQTLTPCDLTNYLFRQKTQELLFATRTLLESQKDIKHILDDPFERFTEICEPQLEARDAEREKLEAIKKQKDQLKHKMKEFFKDMLDYIKAHNLKDDAFFKTLCDDVYIAIQSFDLHHGLMYTSARQTSQGRQQTYTSRPSTQDQYEDGDLMPPTISRQLTIGVKTGAVPSRATNAQAQLMRDPDLNYELSQDDTSGYASLGVLNMMRAVSYQPPKDQDQEPNEDQDKNL